MALFRAGHDEAFGVIEGRYRQRLIAYAAQMLGGARSDAEDVWQDVLVRAYHALRVDARPVSLRAWLYRVAHNRCIDQLRRPSPAAEDIYDLNRVPQEDPMAAAERREDLRRLVRDVGRLPEQQRSALLMREMEGLSYVELAGALGVTIPAVKSLLVRARIGLVEAIEARDTACGDIRTDVAAAHDRGVRVSGRSRRHLRECAGCREYRTALRGVSRQLNGLAPGSGPLATLAKILGLGGAGSGAAAGGSAAVGGAGGAAVVAGGGAASAGGGVAAAGVTAAAGGGAALGTGAAAVTAGKVVAVVAAAAVVGGGAATVEQQVQHQRPATPMTAPASHVRAVATGTAVASTGRGADLPLGTPATPVPAHDTTGGAPSTPAIGDAAGAAVNGVTGAATQVAPVEPMTGGVQAPDDAAEPAATFTPADPATATATTAGPPVGGPASTPGPVAAATSGTAPPPATSTSGDSAVAAAGTGATAAPASAATPAATPPARAASTPAP
ncbi:RNA polymerase sigma factor [Baekduia soli]|uniref:RNA polymerase sigma factor n=1 Tax=Baekduia soli TaxID=496014 RepID=UPI0016521E84|nr:RNA polymerase sigma factor [Baekduia soli]